jgi:hypothetical protein
MLMISAVIVITGGCAKVEAEPVDLSEAKASATVGPDASTIIDGDDATGWSGDATDLSDHPVNVFIRFAAPTTVGRLSAVTNDRKGFIRLTGLEVYAPADGGWALLGSIDGDDLERFQTDPEVVTEGDAQYHLVRFEIDLLPARVEALRLRVTGTARPDNAWPNIHEVRLHSPGPGVEPTALTAAPVPNEGATEALFVRAATGQIAAPVETRYDPAIGYLGYARSFMDTMLAKGTDIYGETHTPMFVSILLLDGQEHPGAMLPAIEGQRQGDRAHFGGNLQHDLPLLWAMEHMSAITGEETYREAALDYLRYFLEHCARTPTGIWPWGEHAHCDFRTNTPGHTTHEYLGAPSLEFWERAWEMSPEAVTGHASGLINHVVNLDTFEFNRHANILEPLPEPRPEGLGFLDFPRHGGFFMQTWAFAWSKTGDAKYLDWIERMLDHQEDTLLTEAGLLPSTSERAGRPVSASLSSTFSCALSMLESVPLLGDTDTARRMERTANGYIEAVAQQSRIANSTPSFTSHYGAGALAGSAMQYVHAHRITGDERFAPMARAVAEKYAEIEELPRVRNTPAQVFGSIINLMLDMHEIDGDARWTDAAERYARTAIERLYYDGLFRGATELWYYESELWVSNLVYALVRLHTVTESTPHRVPPIAFQR